MFAWRKIIIALKRTINVKTILCSLLQNYSLKFIISRSAGYAEEEGIIFCLEPNYQIGILLNYSRNADCELMKIFNLDISSTPKSSPRVGYILSFASTFFAACATVLGKWTLEYISPLLMSALMFSIATVIMSAAYVPFRGLRKVFCLSRKGWLWLLLFATSSLIAIWCFWAGIQKMDPSLAAFLSRSEVLIAILLGIIFLGERFNRRETFAAILSILGIVIMRLTLRMEYSTGFWLVLIGAFFFGLTEFFSKKTVKHVEPVVAVYLRNMIMSVMYWIILLTVEPDYGELNQVWIGVVALAIVGPILSRVVYMMALARLDLSKVAVISQTRPVFVILIAFSVLSQLPTFREIIGGLFLVMGCLIMAVTRQKYKKEISPLQSIQ